MAQPLPDSPTSVLARPLLPASIAIFVTVALAAFEGLAVAAALPEIAADLGDVSLLPWVITSFLLTSGVATVVSGRLIDNIGVKLMFRIAVTVFTIAGVLAAFAPSMPALVALRAVQGAGSGMVIAVGLAAVALIYPPHLTGRAFAANSTVWGVMGVGGPAIAAVILTRLDWRWIFLINLPLGLAALIAGWRVMPDALPDIRRRTIDVSGAVLALVFTAAVLLAVDSLAWISIAWAGLALIAGWFFHRRSERHPAPLIEARFLSQSPFGSLAFAIALMITGAIAANAFVPIYVSAGRSGSAALTAWSVLFFTVGWTSGANVSSRLLDIRSPVQVVTYGVIAVVPGLAATALAAVLELPIAAVFASLYVAGVGIGLATNASLTLLRDISAPDEVGRSTAAHQFFRNQGFAVGSALGGAVIFATVARAVGDPELVRSVLAGEAGGSTDEIRRAVVNGFALASAIGAAIAAIPFLLLARLHKSLADA